MTRMGNTVAATLAALALTLALGPQPALGDALEGDCSQSGSLTSNFAVGPYMAPLDTLRALVIFARFPDGEDVDIHNHSIGNCANCGPGWASTDAYPPAWADSLIEDTLTPSIPGSLTHVLAAMSQGKHIVKGTVLDSVIVSDSTLAYWDGNYGDDFQEVAAANRRILQQINPIVDFSQYDEDSDGFVDFIFINWHSVTSYNEGSSQAYHVNGLVSWMIGPSDTLTVDGTKVVQESGATISSVANGPDASQVFIRHRWQTAASAMHEYCHDLVYLEGHGHGHFRSVSRYGVMQGNLVPGSLIMEGYLRRELGWIDPVVIDPASVPFDTTLTLSTSYLDNDDTFAVLKTQADTPGSSQYFILEAKREGESGEYYNTRQPAANPTCCMRTAATGTGLLVTHITENGSAYGGQTELPAGSIPLIDVETATGRFNVSSGAPDAVKGKDLIDTAWSWGGSSGSDGDLLYPDARIDRTSTMTPFGNPSTHLYRNDGGGSKYYQDVRSGISIYNVELVAGGDSLRCHVRYDGTSAVDADTLKVDTEWQGLVQLMGDVVVDEGVKLEVAPGASVVAAAAQDQNSSGEDDSVCELTVLGRAVLGGVGTDDEDDVVLMSSRDTEFDHFEGPESTGSAAGDWYGVRFEYASCGPSGAYGYVGCIGAPSAIDYTSIRSSQYGIVLDDLTPPAIANSEFDEVTDDRHIFMRSDVVLPEGYWDSSCGTGTFHFGFEWNLKGGTHVVASTGDLNDAWVGTTDKNDLIAYGKLFTDGSTADGDSVFFRPEVAIDPGDSEAGADWGGVLLASPSGGSLLRFADIGYAENPFFAHYPDSLSGLERSRVHHFGDIGIWISGSKGQGGFIDSCLVDRGDDLEQSLGGTGIFLDRVDEFNLLNTQVWLHGRDDPDGGTGIEIGWGKTFCETTPVDHQSLLVNGNFVMGPGLSPTYGEAYSGIHTNWVCGSLDREVDLTANWIEDWKFAGMDFVQTADTQVDCNRVAQSNRAVDIYRDSEPTGTSLRFKNNQFEALVSDTTLFTVRTTDAVKTKLGPAAGDKGDNYLTVNRNLTKFVFDNDSGASDTLDARNNYWRTDSLGTIALIDSLVKITSRIVSSDGLYKVSGFRTEYEELGCEASRPEDAPEDEAFPASLLSLAEASLVGDHSNLPDESGGLPQELKVGQPYPNPGHTDVTLGLAVPKDRIGAYTLEVFDIGGRRLLESRREIAAAGRYPIAWGGRDAGGARVAPGIYFLRLKGPGRFVEVRKVTMVR